MEEFKIIKKETLNKVIIRSFHDYLKNEIEISSESFREINEINQFWIFFARDYSYLPPCKITINSLSNETIHFKSFNEAYIEFIFNKPSSDILYTKMLNSEYKNKILDYVKKSLQNKSELVEINKGETIEKLELFYKNYIQCFCKNKSKDYMNKSNDLNCIIYNLLDTNNEIKLYSDTESRKYNEIKTSVDKNQNNIETNSILNKSKRKTISLKNFKFDSYDEILNDHSELINSHEYLIKSNKIRKRKDVIKNNKFHVTLK